MVWIGLILFILGVGYAFFAKPILHKTIAMVVATVGWYMTMVGMGMKASAAGFMSLAWGFIFWFMASTVMPLTEADKK
jgi:uncharacterized membrane protein